MNVNYKICEGSDWYLTVMKHETCSRDDAVSAFIMKFNGTGKIIFFFFDQLKTLECKMYTHLYVCLFFML